MRRLEAAEERLQALLGLAEGIAFEFDTEGRYRAVWAQSEELLVAPPEMLLGRTLTEVFGPQKATPLLEHIRRVVTTGKSDHLEYELEVAGRRRWFSADAQIVPRRQSVASLVRDITRQKLFEQRLHQTDRLAALGTLVAGMAHEINNPLSYVSSNLSFISQALTSVRCALSRPDAAPDFTHLVRTLEECSDALTEVQEGTARIRHVVGDLRTFARGEDTIDGWVNVRRALELSLNMAHAELQYRARLVRRLEEVPPVRGNESRLGQVFLNMLLNAAQAIPPGVPEEHAVEVRLRSAGGWVVTEIQDTGEGIAPENLKRIFDPFFSTKPVGEGTGLGLAICHGIITGMRGNIEVESTLGRGTCFRVLLPVLNDGAPPEASGAPGQR